MSGEPAGDDLYAILGVRPDADRTDMARAYRRLARRYHPDHNSAPEAEGQFARIAHAYRVLSDPQARARYDSTRVIPRRRTASRRGPRAGHSPWTSASTVFRLGDPAPRFAPSSRGRAARDEPEEAEVDLTLAEAYHGATRTVTVTGSAGTEAVRVEIPRGATDAQRIPVPLRHQASGAPPLVLRIHLVHDERCRVEGRDVHLDLPLTPWEAALGTTVTISLPIGTHAIDLPAGSSSGRVVTVPGLGLPSPDGRGGALRLHLRIVLPPRLTPAERDLLQRLADVSTFDPRGGPVGVTRADA